MGLASCSGRNIHPELTEDQAVLQRQWTFDTFRGAREAGVPGAEYSNPLLLEDTLVLGTQSTGLIALYPTLAQTRWVLPIAGGVVSELAVDQGSVYFGGGDGFLYSVNLENGHVNWRYELRNPSVSRPTVSGGRVFVTTSDDVVYAFDSGTGKWLWHYRRRSSQPATIYGASAPLVEGNEVLAGLSDGFLVSLSIFDGQLKSERKLHTGTKFTDVDAHPVIDGGVLYIPSYDGSLYALKKDTKDVIWRFEAGGVRQVAIEGDRLFLPSSDGTIYALQKDSSKVLWKFELDGGTPTQILTTDRYLIVGSSFQYLYVLDKQTGEGKYRLNIGYGSGFSGSFSSSPSQNQLFAFSSGGRLYSFKIQGEGNRKK